jgi:hypothetical protein
MPKFFARFFALLAFAAAVFFAPSLPAREPPPPPPPPRPYCVSHIFQIGGVGGWDYLTVDSIHHLLFVPRVTHTQVLQAATGAVVADIPGQKHNHGVALVPNAGRGFISDGEDASVMVFDLRTYQVLGKVKVKADADGIIYDPFSNKVLVVCGDAACVVPISPDLDPALGQADAPIPLGGKPEFLVADGRGTVFINVANRDVVAVLDTKTMKVTARWPTAPGGAPVGLSMDRARRRLYVGCRDPRDLVVMSADTGAILSTLPIGAGVDATGYDGFAFASCRDGSLSVAQEFAPNRFEILQVVQTRAGARTLGIDEQTHMLYLPTAIFPPGSPTKGRPVPKPGSFMILVVSPTEGG